MDAYSLARSVGGRLRKCLLAIAIQGGMANFQRDV